MERSGPELQHAPVVRDLEKDGISWRGGLRSNAMPVAYSQQAVRTAVRFDSDILEARRKGREIALRLTFSPTDSALIAAAISELARNIIQYARQGEITISVVAEGGQRGILIEARDDGPGIADIGKALRDGFSTSGGLGLGLPAVRRLMDEFEFVSEESVGTTVRATKWLR